MKHERRSYPWALKAPVVASLKNFRGMLDFFLYAVAKLAHWSSSGFSSPFLHIHIVQSKNPLSKLQISEWRYLANICIVLYVKLTYMHTVALIVVQFANCRSHWPISPQSRWMCSILCIQATHSTGGRIYIHSRETDQTQTAGSFLTPNRAAESPLSPAYVVLICQ